MQNKPHTPQQKILYHENGTPMYSLKVGDMFSTDHGFGLITKITSRKYYYQIAAGTKAYQSVYGVPRQEFWLMADDSVKFNNLTIHYGPEMRYRRRRKVEL